VSRLLFAAGAKGKNGRPFPVGTLYSTVWRKREDAKRIGGGIASSSKSTTRIQGSTQESPPRKGRMVPAPIRSGNVELPRKPKGRLKIPEASTGQSSPMSSVKTPPKASSNKDLLAFMRRSATVRGFKSEK